MPGSIEQLVSSITEDRRADYIFDTKIVAQATGMHANKFNQQWKRTKEFLTLLAIAQPGQLAAEVAVIIALAEVERQRRAAE